MTRSKVIGRIRVDSGRLILVDPCYIVNNWGDREYDGSFQVMNNDDFAGKFEECISFEAGPGDGEYKVIAEYTKDEDMQRERITRIIIDFEN